MSTKNNKKKRIKTVFNNQELCHVFASQSQKHGRNSSWAMYFYGGEIFSYGRHYMLGKIIDSGKAILINSDSYSPTTSHHRSSLYRATHHLVQITVPYVDIIDSRMHNSNIEYLTKLIEDEIKLAISTRKKYQYKIWRQSQLETNIDTSSLIDLNNNLEQYCRIFRIENKFKLDLKGIKKKIQDANKIIFNRNKIKKRRNDLITYFNLLDDTKINKIKRIQNESQLYKFEIENNTTIQLISHLENDLNIFLKIKKLWHRSELRKYLNQFLDLKGIELVENLDLFKSEIEKFDENQVKLFKSHKINRLSPSIGYYLRVSENGKEVESSDNAVVPLDHVIRLISLFKSNRKQLENKRVGHYTIDKVNGVLKVGCHTFEISEIENLISEIENRK